MAERFKKGDALKVQLSAKHTLNGDLVEHPAKFVRYLPEDWAEVELDAHHSIDGGRKVLTLSVPLAQLVAALLLLFLFATPSRAQFLGYTSPQTVNQQVFGAQTASATSPVFTQNCTPSPGNPCGIPNIGQSIHFVVTRSSGTCSFRLALEASQDGSSWFPIAEGASDTGNAANPQFTGFFASGSFPAYRLNFIRGICSGSIQTWYSGTSVANGTSGGIVNLSSNFRRVLALSPNTALTLTAQINFVYPPTGNTSATLYWQTQSNPCAGGSLLVQSGIDGAHLSSLTTISPANNTNLQTFTLPSASAGALTFQYTACGTETYDAILLFTGTQAPLSGNTSMFSPVQLGVNALTEPAAGTSALSNIIDTRGVKSGVVKFNCTAGTVTLNVQEYADDGSTTLALVSPVSGVAAATNADVYIGSESNPAVDTGTLATPPAGVVRFPQRALAFSFTNAGGAGTCTARLFLNY